MHTKEKILDTALTLFSEQGYHAVSVGEIAEAVGIKPPSLYKHFESKEDIFESCVTYFYAKTGALNETLLPAVDQEATSYQNITNESLLLIARSLFTFYLTDDVAARFRKMLLIERYRSPELNQLFEDLFIDGSIEYETAVFAKLIEAQIFKPTDPGLLAMRFYTPIFFLLQKYDLRLEQLDEALEELTILINDFTDQYSVKGANECRGRK